MLADTQVHKRQPNIAKNCRGLQIREYIFWVEKTFL